MWTGGESEVALDVRLHDIPHPVAPRHIDPCKKIHNEYEHREIDMHACGNTFYLDLMNKW